jgi:hypothetical protein
VDPLSDEYPSTSPYMYVLGNPIMFTDPWGMNANPIFDESGELLGTDSEGWKGEAIVMKKDDFKQGMDHSKAEDKGTYLSKYGEGIKITDESWDKVEKNGGERMTPYVENNSDESFFYKPEGKDENGNDLNPGYNSSESYEVEAGKDLYAPIDGVKTHLYKNVVFKVTTKNKLRINKGGHVSISKYDGSFFKQIIGGGWLTMKKYDDWKSLRERKIGEKVYIPWQYKF